MNSFPFTPPFVGIQFVQPNLQYLGKMQDLTLGFWFSGARPMFLRLGDFVKLPDCF